MMVPRSYRYTAPQPSPKPVPAERRPSERSMGTFGLTITRPRGSSASRKSRLPSNHQPDAVPPAVAAVLALTSIPPPKRKTTRRRSQYADRRISIDELMEEWRSEHKEASPGSYGSPLDILLERPDECDSDCYSIETGSTTERGFMASRSVSSESIPSVPDLDLDEHSLTSWSSPSTPTRSSSLSRRYRSERKEKPVSSPPKEDCMADHPLLPFGDPESDDEIVTPTAELPPVRQTPSLRLRSAFTSNLTASFQALKSAAKSFSNFTAPSLPPDDLLTRSLLAPRFASEMRPKPLEGTPTAALRRYLNPATSTRPLSPTELSQQLHEALLHGQSMEDEAADDSAPMIQMQTYQRRSRSTSRQRRQSRGGSLDLNSEAGRALSPQPAVRQREPRENGDFLRVIVLEMNMRREGKLDARAVGRARIWLPPRKTGNRGDVECGGVPMRWVGRSMTDEDT
ncbi:hypothetical protein K490DRAFT_73348 [Saccharata proteae CBS 121410]|uniref:Uncharacterized protein n=1 Tax=Saccharata proteae CBS 121410 TaxID=1314787 RepID=A0A9P4M0F1_9PEZI|nr:hypothetical protein K490DRAFT_73348 [Saccharata proteae CBS 121410]